MKCDYGYRWETKVLGAGPLPVPLCWPVVPYGLACDQLWASAVRGWWLAFWAVAWLTVFSDKLWFNERILQVERNVRVARIHPYIQKERCSAIAVLMWGHYINGPYGLSEPGVPTALPNLCPTPPFHLWQYKHQFVSCFNEEAHWKGKKSGKRRQKIGSGLTVLTV